MKYIVLLMALLAGAGQATHAQTNEKLFDLPDDYFHRRFLIAMGNGNQLQVEVVHPDDLQSLTDIDSILAVFLHDFRQLRDSLQEELPAKRIDYRIGSDGQNKLRVQTAIPGSASYLIQSGDISALKLTQDSIFIIGEARPVPGRKTYPTAPHLYRLGFFVNRITDLDKYTGGLLNDKIKSLNNVSKSMWVMDKSRRWHIDKGDPSVSAERPAGYTGPNDDFLQLTAGAGLQNYKNYFTPSLNVSAWLVFRKPFITYKAGLSWDTYFFFAKDPQNKLQAYRNHFLSLDLEARPAQHAPAGTAQFTLFQHLSFGYLIKQNGDFMDPRSFRLSTGLLSWYDERIKLEPVVFFQNFFKNGSPGLSLKMAF
ncbi:MAG: hypothetical protein KGO82_03665 [Bacteroidota bacterium]|nr:hypothetical protein [Bacteroidota bacterium]